VPFEIAAGSHTLSEVKPQFRVRHSLAASRIFGALFVAHVRQHGVAQLARFQAHPKSREIGRKCFDMVIVVLRVLTQILTCQLSRRPCFIKRMAKKVVFSDAGVEFLEESGGFHNFSSSGVTANIKANFSPGK
jgi:hypothetical protein